MRNGIFRVWAALGYCLENVQLPKLQNATKVKQDTPEHCTYLTCVHNAFHIEFWLGCTSNHFTIPGSNMTHWYFGDGPKKKKKKPDCCHTKLQTFSHYAMNQVSIGIQRYNHLNENKNVFLCAKDARRRLIKSKRCHESLGASVSLISP